jgi:hypothetical protein
VSSIDRRLRIGIAGIGLIAGCTSAPAPAPSGAATAAAKPSPTAAAAARPHGNLPPPGPVRNWNEVRLQAAHRLVAANPAGTYTGAVPDPLLAIPVLEIELNADGSVRRIDVLRQPRQASDTTQLAADAVRRAAPFGDVSRLPRPWRFTETFLFDDERRFKPRTLDD